MTAKQFLYSIRDERGEIDEIKNRIYELEMSLLPGAIRYDSVKVDTSPTDKTTERLAEIADYKAELEGKLTSLTKRLRKAQKLIDTLDNSIQRQILNMYFLEMRRARMDDIASIIGYSTRQVYRAYTEALKTLDDKMSEDVIECQ